MNPLPQTSEESQKAAGIAGPMKILWLALTGIAFLAVGIGVGYLLQGKTSLSGGSHKAGAEASHTDSDTHAASERTLEELDAEEVAETHGEEQGHHGGSSPAEIASESSDEFLESADELASEMAAVQRSQSHDDAPAGDLRQPRPLPDLPTGLPAERLARADKLLLLGNYRQARTEYASLLKGASEVQRPELLLRRGLCEESIGDYKQAQSTFREVIELRPAIELRDAAILGQARLWCHAGRRELGIITLFQAIMNGTHQGNGGSHSQIPHQLAVLLAQRVKAAGHDDGTSQNYLLDETLLSPTLLARPHEIIAGLASRELTPMPDQFFSVNDVSVVEKFNASPEETFLNVRAERTTVLELLRRVSSRAGWKIKITEEARLRLQEHTVQTDGLNLPMSLVLDALLEPMECMWLADDASLLVLLSRQATAKEIEEFQIKAAQRTLRFACAFSPEHPWAAASSMELSRLSAQTGAAEAASRYLNQMLAKFPRSEFQAIGWFNLAKIELLQGNLETSLSSFQRSCDLLVGHPMEPLAYLYAGRVQMESDRTRDSIPALTRALVLSEGTRFEPIATLQLSCAYLLLEHYQRANEILIEHRGSLKGSAFEDQAAFLGTLIQYRSTKDKHEQFRAAATLLGTLTNLHAEKCFGGHWMLLVGSVFRDFGMHQQEVKVLRTCLQGPYAFPLQNRIRQMLLEDAPDQLIDVQPQMVAPPTRGKTSPLYFQTQLKEAATSLHQGNSQAALQMSRELVAHPHIEEEDRRAALRLMGRIYQSRGEHEMAIQCFSGIVPNENPVRVPPTAALPFPERGVQ